MTEIAHSKATVEVWLTNDGDGPLHKGPAIEYVITVANGQPQGYQRTFYRNGNVVTARSGDPSGVPDYVREQVEEHMIPRGAWPN